MSDSITKVGKKPQCNSERTAIIAAQLALGLPKKTAAILGGIKQSTFYSWIYKGERAIKRIRDNPGSEFKELELVYVEFVEVTNLAIAKFKQKAMARIDLAARGGREYEEKKVTTKTLADGSTIVEETITVKVEKASWQASAWELERRFPQEFGKQLHVTQTLDDKLDPFLPKDVTSDDIVEQLKGLLVDNPELLTKLTEKEPKVIDVSTDSTANTPPEAQI